MVLEFSSQSDQGLVAQLRQAIAPNLPQLKKIIGLIAIAIVVSIISTWLHIPVAWLLTPMLVGISYAMYKGSRQPLPAKFKLVGQVIVGLATATRFSPETLMMASSYALPLLGCVVATGSLSMFNGYLLSRWAGIDRTTAFLGFIPGAASSIVVMSEEMGADAIAVALIQYIRVLMVVVILPAIATFLFPHLDNPATATIAITKNLPTLPIGLNLFILALCGTLGIWAGKRLHLPSAGFLGPFLVGLVTLWLLPYQLQLPQPIFSAGLLLIGLSIGVQFDWHTARKLLKAVLVEIGLVIALILMCLAIGYGFHLLTNADTVTAILGFTPGGIEAMIATVMQLGGDTGLVMAMQLTRMLSIILIAPWLVSFLVKRQQFADGK